MALFHVEQWDHSEPPRARWRLADPALPEPYHAWVTREIPDRLTLITPAMAAAAVEVEWFDPRAGDGGAWRQVALLRLTRGNARFRITAKHAVGYPRGFTAVAAMEPFGVAGYVFPALSLAAGEVYEVNARPEGLCLANLLLAPDVFHPRHPSMEITNLTPVLHGWMIDPPGPIVLSQNLYPPPHYFAIAGTRVVVPSEDPTHF